MTGAPEHGRPAERSRRVAQRAADVMLFVGAFCIPAWAIAVVVDWLSASFVQIVAVLAVLVAVYVPLRRFGGPSPFSRTFREAFEDDIPSWWPRRRSELEQQRQAGDREHHHDDEQRDLTQ